MLLLLLLLLPTISQLPPAAAEGGAILRGRVMDKETGAPMPRAFVSLRPPLGGSAHQTLADDRGQFEFVNVPPGPYELIAAAGEHKSTHVATPYRRSGTGPHELLIMPGDVLANLDIALPRAFVITGRVVDGTGMPLAGVHMDLIIYGSEARAAIGVRPVTDDRGMFRIYGIPAGQYTLCADPQLGPSFDAAAGRTMYIRTCHIPPIEIRGDVAISPLRLDRIGTLTISGSVLSASGGVPQNAIISLTRTEPAGSRTSSITMRADGVFVAQNVLPGTYFLSAGTNRFRNPAPSEAPVEWGGVPVEITTANVEGVVLQLTQGASVRGRVAFEDPVPDETVRGIEVRATSALRGLMPPTAVPAETDENGDFVLSGMFGPVLLRVRMPSGYATKSIRYGGRDVTETPTEFEGDPRHVAEIVLTNRTSALSGRVLDDLGNPATDAWVLYFPADPARWRGFDGGVRQQVTTGRYRITGLVAGDYFVVALKGYRPGFAESDYEALATIAERVTILENERRTADLRLLVVPPRRKE